MSARAIIVAAAITAVVALGTAKGVEQYHHHLDLRYEHSLAMVESDVDALGAKPDLTQAQSEALAIARTELARAKASQQLGDRDNFYDHLQVAAIDLISAQHGGSVPVDEIKPGLQRYDLDD